MKIFFIKTGGVKGVGLSIGQKTIKVQTAISLTLLLDLC